MAANNSFQPLTDLAELEFVRPTQLATFAACPRQLEAVLLGEQPRKESKAAQVGTAAHAVIEEFLGGIENTGQWEAYAAAAGMTGTEFSLLTDYLSRIRDWRRQVFAIEQEFTLPVPGHDGLPIRGHIDLILEDADGGCTIVDHKTNRTSAPLAWWQEQVQPRAYAWAVRQLWPDFNPIRFRIGYVLLGVFREWEVTPQMDFMVADVHGRFTVSLRDRIFPEHLNDGCKWCPRMNVCRTYMASVRRFFGVLMEENDVTG